VLGRLCGTCIAGGGTGTKPMLFFCWHRTHTYASHATQKKPRCGRAFAFLRQASGTPPATSMPQEVPPESLTVQSGKYTGSKIKSNNRL